MFISKKKYQEKLDLIEGYRNRCMKKYDEVYSLEVEVENLKGLVKIMEERNKELEDQIKNNSRTRYRTWKEHLENKEVSDERKV